MRKLTRYLFLLVLAAIGWGIYWYVGAQATERGLSAWLEARRGEGWTAEAATLATNGFPNRFDTTFEELDLADPDTGVGWSAPWFQILSLSYKPTHVIAVWPEQQELRLPDETLAVAATRMIGSLELGATPTLPLQQIVVEGTEAALASSQGWTADVAAAQVALRERADAGAAPASDPTYDIAVTLDGFVPDSTEIKRLRNLVGLPAEVETLSAELTVAFDKGWDRSAIEDRRPQPREIEITALRARWGDLALSGAGRLTVDADGVGTGELNLEATNWRDILALAEASGALPEAQVPLVRGVLETLARLAGDPDRLDVPLRLSRGFVLIGPVPLGVAPRFALP